MLLFATTPPHTKHKISRNFSSNNNHKQEEEKKHKSWRKQQLPLTFNMVYDTKIAPLTACHFLFSFFCAHFFCAVYSVSLQLLTYNDKIIDNNVLIISFSKFERNFHFRLVGTNKTSCIYITLLQSYMLHCSTFMYGFPLHLTNSI